MDATTHEDNFRVSVDGTKTIYVRDHDYMLHQRDAEMIASSVHLETNDPNRTTKLHKEEMRLTTNLAPFFKNEIVLGKRLARGSFADIYEINHFFPRQNASRHFLRDKVNARSNVLALASQVNKESIRNLNKSDRDGVTKLTANVNQFVVKHLKPELLSCPDDFHKAAVGLAKETKVLSSLQHPNIVTLRGISAHGPAGYAQGHYDAYFLVLDRHNETLSDRIRIWQEKQKSSRLQTMPLLSSLKKTKLILERLKVLTDIADALAYLHKKNIVHRDLKLCNFVFDHRNSIKLIDFGLSRELPLSTTSTTTNHTNCSTHHEETYHLTGNTGTMRYMAPEVYFCKPYNAKADVYSFAVIMYSTMVLSTKVFHGLTPSQMQKRVYERATRPPLLFLSSFACPDGICKAIEKGWSHDYKLRPTSQAMLHSLTQVLENEEEKLQQRSSCTTGEHKKKLSISLKRMLPNLSHFKISESPLRWPPVTKNDKEKSIGSSFSTPNVKNISKKESNRIF